LKVIKTKTIQIFEHQHIQVGDNGFEKSHWETLGYYNENHGGRYFTLTPKGIRFCNYVGVIQVGNLNIEVLPKIGKVVGEADKTKWQKVLIDMLRECRWMKVYANEKAALRFKPNSILEAYLELFLQHCEEIIRQGLVKKYRTTDDNCGALKGKLLLNKQLHINLIHQERFYVRHQTYDRENIFNQILLKALKLIPSICQSPVLSDRVANLRLLFPELEDILVNYSTFEDLIYDRKTIRYQEAIEIAAMLLLNYRPDISTGHNHVLAILFDMNDLWEEYIFRQLNKFKPQDWLIGAQNTKKFWQSANSTSSKVIRPDIVIYNKTNDSRIILDTKWKIPENNVPADSDLKQMFVYNEYWSGKNALLVYPTADYTDIPEFFGGSFSKKEALLTTHNCGLMKVSVLDKNHTKLDNTIGKRINEFLNDEIFK